MANKVGFNSLPRDIKLEIFSLFNPAIINKIARYAENFDKGGHDDSLNDISVYAAMLRSIDRKINEVPFW